MDRLLRPKIFETEPSTVNAEKLYRHWKVTFENYLEANIAAIPTATPGDAASEAAERTATAAANRKKKQALFNNVSSDIFELIEHSADYDAAIAVLDATYIRPTSVVYCRHKLITSKQESQSIDTFKQHLERTAKSCNFQAVTAEQNKNQYIRDAFINGLSSSHIRQRLLENIGDLSLEDAFAQARALEQAQSQSSAYENHEVAALPDSTPQQPTLIQENDKDSLGAAGNNRNNSLNSGRNTNNNYRNNRRNNRSQQQNSCYFCGNQRHPQGRSACPAQGHVCKNCGKLHHWERVSNSSPALPVGAVGGPPPDPALA